ncbi:MAG: ATP-binding protein [Clostridiales bacterium]|nr:ATP-binding protein [Clostridiales bacterium]
MNPIKVFSDKLNALLDSWMDRMGLSIRTKLIVIFLIVKIVPLVVLLLIAWSQFAVLGKDIGLRTSHLTEEMTTTITTGGEMAVDDTTNALIANAVEQIERITTDTAHAVADFLYERDNDIRFLATLEPTEENYRGFAETRTGRLTKQGVWDLSKDGMIWECKNAPQHEGRGDVSTNEENNDEVNGTGFNYRPADTYTFVDVPYYDEISFIGPDLVEQFKVVPEDSAKKHFPMDEEPRDISDKANTYVGAEGYGGVIENLEPGEIYVSDVIGAYVPSHFIGMYTPKQIIISAINAEVAALVAMEPQTDEISALADILAGLAGEGIRSIETAGSALGPGDCITGSALGPGDCEMLMDGTIHETLLMIDNAAKDVSSPELRERIVALKNKVSGLKFDPAEEAFAGEENPLGIHFEGIVRWVTPVERDGEVIGYVSFALNHDHIMEFTDHITPLAERYKELSSAFEGNYAFIWDYQCRNIAHPRHHSVVGYDPETGAPQIPWLETSIYEGLLKGIGGEGLPDLKDRWCNVINDPEPPDPDHPGIGRLLPGVDVFDGQSRTKRPAPELTAAGLVGLDGRYLNNAPQCTGWMDLTQEGGSGSFYILWSGLYKLTTAAAIPYYTGQYAPSEANGFSKRGFAMVTVGAGLEDFQRPAESTAEAIAQVVADANESIMASAAEAQQMITDSMGATTFQLSATTAIIVFVVILIAIWMASFIAGNINVLVRGLTRFRMGDRRFRFLTARTDEFGDLADIFDDMAGSIETSVASPLSITDMDLNIVYMNDMGLEASGNANVNVVGKSYKNFSVYPFATEYCPISAFEQGRDAEVYFNERNGRYYKGSAKYLFGREGEKIGYIIASTDMTDASLNRLTLEHAVEEAQRANEHKNEFLARMSHEIRTPMNAIIGVTNIVEKKLGSIKGPVPGLSDIKGNISQIENSSQHLLGLLNDILDLSKIEAGKIVIAHENVNISKLADAVKGIILPRCSDNAIDFEMEIDESLSDTLYVTDPLRLRQVLINLLGNAVKFTPEHGHIRFQINKASDNGETARLLFLVEDDGIGIDKEYLLHIFEAFEQGDGSITRKYGGTGLGLPISRSMVQMLGGDIEVRSETGKGSCFTFELELKAAGAAARDTEPEKREASDFSGKRILIVDDVDINRMIVASLLGDTGITSLEAGDGSEAVDIFKESDEGSINIILMDVMMPVLDGLEATAAIRALPRADAKSVPIIALTANAFKEDVDKTLASGMDAHLAKPIDPDTLIEMIKSFLI